MWFSIFTNNTLNQRYSFIFDISKKKMEFKEPFEHLAKRRRIDDSTISVYIDQFVYLAYANFKKHNDEYKRFCERVVLNSAILLARLPHILRENPIYRQLCQCISSQLFGSLYYTFSIIQKRLKDHYNITTNDKEILEAYKRMVKVLDFKLVALNPPETLEPDQYYHLEYTHAASDLFSSQKIINLYRDVEAAPDSEAIGVGSFCDVYKCQISVKDYNGTVACAHKKYKCTVNDNFKHYLVEMSVLRWLRGKSKYVIHLIGQTSTSIYVEPLDKAMSQILNDDKHEEYYLKWIGQLVEAIKDIHEAGVAHRDISVGNIMVDRNMDIRLIDFGAACFLGAGTEQTHDDQDVMTTCFYRPPEGWNRCLNPDWHKFDVWSLGCIIFELFMHRPMFRYYDRCHKKPDIKYGDDIKSWDMVVRDQVSASFGVIINHLGSHNATLWAQMMRVDPEERIGSKELFESWDYI